VHDYNGGIQPSGLFWTVELPNHPVMSWEGGRHAIVRAANVPVIDSFQFFGPNEVPASVSFEIRWDATGPALDLGSGGSVDPTDPAAFLGQFAAATSTGSFSGTGLGFSFRGSGSASADSGYAQIGRERNGEFL
jgi:hypothetical protein